MVRHSLTDVGCVCIGTLQLGRAVHVVSPTAGHLAAGLDFVAYLYSPLIAHVLLHIVRGRRCDS